MISSTSTHTICFIRLGIKFYKDKLRNFYDFALDVPIAAAKPTAPPIKVAINGLFFKPFKKVFNAQLAPIAAAPPNTAPPAMLPANFLPCSVLPTG